MLGIKAIFPSPCIFLKKTVDIIDIIVVEAYATLKHTLPASLAWVWRKYITHEIKTIPIEITVNKVKKIAYLNIHENKSTPNTSNKALPVLLSHGDYGHPYTMLHLADIAQKEGRKTFTLYIPGVEDNNQFDAYSDLLKQAVDKIEDIVKNEYGNFPGLLGAGHSKAAILLADRQFVALDLRLKATCSIAGRLRVVNDHDCPDQDLQKKVKAIYERIINQPKLSLFQIIPKEDWNASYESMAVRPHEHCHIVPGKHLSGLYSNATRMHFKYFLKTFGFS